MAQPKIIVVPINGAALSVVGVLQAVALADKARDKLFIITAVVEKHTFASFATVAERLFPPHTEDKEAHARAAISDYVQKARLAGMRDVSGVVAFGSSFVDYVTKEVQTRNANIVVLGPHMAPMAEHLAQHAPRVQIILAQGEIPVDTRALEEEERSRRVAEDRAEREQAAVAESTAHQVALHYTRFAEHDEQDRRIREEKFRDVANDVVRTVNIRQSDKAQTAEQCERIAHMNFDNALQDIERFGNVREANKAEKEEQQRRVTQTILSDVANCAARKAMLKAVVAVTEQERARQMASPTFKERCPKTVADFVGVAPLNRPASPGVF